jgi:hypothetical protein
MMTTKVGSSNDLGEIGRGQIHCGRVAHGCILNVVEATGGFGRWL